MNFRKKLIVMLSCIMLTALLLVGCDKSNEQSSPSTTMSVETEASSNGLSSSSQGASSALSGNAESSQPSTLQSASQGASSALSGNAESSQSSTLQSASQGASSVESSSLQSSSTAPSNFTITWNDENGSPITTTSVANGTEPSYTYTKADTAEWDYTVEGWSLTQNGAVLNSLPLANANATYYAVVTRVKNKYTITFDSNGGPTVNAITNDYGTSVSAPSVGDYTDHHFVAWCSDAELQNEVSWPVTLTENVTYYAKWNEKVDISAYLLALLNGYKLNPYSLVPEAMRPDYAPNLLAANQTATNYTSFANVSDIKSNGFGEQWNMVLTNLEQSKTFFNILQVVEGLTSTSVSVFNNYMDTNPSNTAHHSFLSGTYTVTIDFDGSVMFYVLDYTATIPVIGEQTIQIALGMNVANNNITVRIQAGEANALIYRIQESSYEFAIKYLGVRSAYFLIRQNNDNTIDGHIYEYLTVEDVGIKSAADFYFGEEYVSVVGNKAGAMLGFSGYINELYNVETGKMLGYEVKETISALTYNTLWFDLNNLSGITTIKYREKTDSAAAAFFVNNLTKEWETKKVGGLSLKTASRRFDLEFRTQYFYRYNTTDKAYEEVAYNVPMLFVQEENLATLTEDIFSTNGVNANITLTNAVVNKIMADYDSLITVFEQNKDDIVTEEAIIAYIGNKISFTTI